MSLDYVRVAVVRTENTHFGGGDYDETEGQIPGSPFLARVYRAAQKVFSRDEAPVGNASVDQMQRLAVMDPTCPIREGDVALLPQPGGGTRRASVVLCRPYSDRVQYDLELGAEGDAGAVPGPLLNPPAPSAQAQIDAQEGKIDALTAQLAAQTAQLGELEMSFRNTAQYTGKRPTVTISASTTLTKPAQPTDYLIDTTSAAVVITLWASTGDGTDYTFFKTAGANQASFALPGTDTTAATLANTVLANNGDSQPWEELAANKWGAK